MRPPKPLRVGARTGGPPLSVQRKLSRRSSWCDQFNSICPLDTDKDPYLAALVASSCNVTAKACAALGSNKTSGPPIRTRVPPFSNREQVPVSRLLIVQRRSNESRQTVSEHSQEPECALQSPFSGHQPHQLVKD